MDYPASNILNRESALHVHRNGLANIFAELLISGLFPYFIITHAGVQIISAVNNEVNTTKGAGRQ